MVHPGDGPFIRLPIRAARAMLRTGAGCWPAVREEAPVRHDVLGLPARPLPTG
jgi:hypothetical protein